MHRALKSCLAALCLMPSLLATPLQAASSFGLEHSLSWAANLGWLNWRGDFEHGVEANEFVCSGYIYGANVGWINLGNGVPLNGINYQNNSAADFGVNVGESGSLSGLAYGANIGWITFAPAGQPRIDQNTGKLSGFVYGANVGWISLGDCTFTLQIESLGVGRDSDGDAIPDVWENAHASNLTTLSANNDVDQDGQSDLEEYLADTDPADPLDHLRILKFTLATDRSSASLTWGTRSSRQYLVETRSSFELADSWSDAGFGLLNADGPNLSRDVPLPPGETQRYFRIRAVRPLSR